MKIAALDLGTNSFLCLIAEVEGGQITKVYDDQVKVVRLGQEVNKTKRFHPQALLRAKQCLQEFSENIQKHKPEKVLAMATSAARDVSNAEELLQIGRELNIPIEIIPGGKEATITFQGTTADLAMDGKTRLVIDVGGGSTEFIVGINQKVLFSKSLNIGCVRLTEQFMTRQPVSNSEFELLNQNVNKAINEIHDEILKNDIAEVIAVAGTPSALAVIEIGHFDPKEVEGFLISKKKLKSWTEEFSRLSVPEIVRKYKVEQGRADVIFVGTLILWRSLEVLNLKELKVSTRGVRHGVAIELAKRERQ